MVRGRWVILGGERSERMEAGDRTNMLDFEEIRQDGLVIDNISMQSLEPDALLSRGSPPSD